MKGSPPGSSVHAGALGAMEAPRRLTWGSPGEPHGVALSGRIQQGDMSWRDYDTEEWKVRERLWHQKNKKRIPILENVFSEENENSWPIPATDIHLWGFQYAGLTGKPSWQTKTKLKHNTHNYYNKRQGAAVRWATAWRDEMWGPERSWCLDPIFSKASPNAQASPFLCLFARAVPSPRLSFPPPHPAGSRWGFVSFGSQSGLVSSPRGNDPLSGLGSRRALWQRRFLPVPASSPPARGGSVPTQGRALVPTAAHTGPGLAGAPVMECLAKDNMEEAFASTAKIRLIIPIC